MQRYVDERAFAEITTIGSLVEVREGPHGAAGTLRATFWGTPEEARADAERIAATLRAGGYAADGKGPSWPRGDAEVAAVLDELRALGARITTGDERATEDDLHRAEDELGFALPDELREFFRTWGQLKVERERTWNFYGLREALAVTEVYRAELAPDDDDDVTGKGPYRPTRFLTLYDEGDYANIAAGTIYDADLDALIVTDGARWLDREDAFQVGYFGFLLDELDGIRERLADPDDVIVADGARAFARRDRARREAQARAAAAPAVTHWRTAVERAHEIFGEAPPSQRDHFCFQGEDCADCAAGNAARRTVPPRELAHEQLFHFAYMARLGEADQRATYRSLLPRIVELLEDLGWHGNPSVVYAQLLQHVAELDLTAAEADAIDGVLLGWWELLLWRPPEQDRYRDPRKDLLGAIANRRPHLLERCLATWTAALDQPLPLAHAGAFVEAHNFDGDASYDGWREAPFTRLRAWLRGDVLRAALVRGKLTAALAHLDAEPTPAASSGDLAGLFDFFKK